MPTSKIQTELCKMTKVDADDHEKRQDLLDAILTEVNTFSDAKWDKMSEPAQLWVNAAIKARKAEKKLPEFPDVGAVKPGADDEDEEEAAPKKKKAAAADDDDEDEAPKKKKKAPVEDDDDEDEAPKKKKKPVEESDDDEDEAPKKKKKPAADADDDEDEAPKKKKKAPVEDDDDEEEAPKKKKKPAADDEDEEEETPKKKKKPAAEDEDEEEETPKKKKKTEAVPQKASGVKVAIKTAIVNNPEISVDEIVKKLGKGGAEVSKVTVSNVRADFRHSLKLLKELGKLKGIEL